MLNVTNSPFTEQQAELLNRLLPDITEKQQIWLTGYLSGFSTNHQQAVAVLEQTQPDSSVLGESIQAVQEITILYGSQTGNCQQLAEQYGEQLKQPNRQVSVASLSEFKNNAIKKAEYILLIVSTHGEGDPPDTAKVFYDFILSERAPKLDHLQYAVLALGDSSYEFFCHTGKQFDERFAALGAQPLVARKDCDLDFDDDAAEWFAAVSAALQQQAGGDGVTAAAAGIVGTAGVAGAGLSSAPTGYSRTNPYYATVLENINLNGRGSNKETRHLELSIEDAGLTFEPGDSIGIYPQNNPSLVEQLLELTGFAADEQVTLPKLATDQRLEDVLTSQLEITVLTKPLLEQAAPYLNDRLTALLEQPEQLRQYIVGRDLLDLLRDYGPLQATAQQFISLLRKLPPRLYSIASSHRANPDEVHLLIGTVRYESYDRAREGVCSVQCAERLEIGDTLPIYVHKNSNFRLPANPEAPVIMVGPGTGIAPFRSFMEEREEIAALGETWLFFGEQHYVTDFYYQTEWQRWIKQGVLTKLDVAFSRDTKEKVYVQHRMYAQKTELYSWLERGAYLYICGDEARMAHDVHETLRAIIAEEGSMDEQAAESYLTELMQQKRYQRDVY